MGSKTYAQLRRDPGHVPFPQRASAFLSVKRGAGSGLLVVYTAPGRALGFYVGLRLRQSQSCLTPAKLAFPVPEATPLLPPHGCPYGLDRVGSPPPLTGVFLPHSTPPSTDPASVKRLREHHTICRNSASACNEPPAFVITWLPH